jgi:hypothetical protein
MRFNWKAIWDTSIKTMLNTLNWQSVEQKIGFNTWKFIHKIEAKFIEKYIRKINEVHNYNLRRTSEFNRPQFKEWIFRILIPNLDV